MILIILMLVASVYLLYFVISNNPDGVAIVNVPALQTKIS